MKFFAFLSIYIFSFLSTNSTPSGRGLPSFFATNLVVLSSPSVRISTKCTFALMHLF